ncbi:histidine kinase [Microbulbifer sp. VAAC004]|uniref:histidine kinase n=1 Tax=unclassified Microbulbifer TaxID=2619833 RepID=UPI00403AD33E
MPPQSIKAIFIITILSLLTACSSGGSGSNESNNEETPAVEETPDIPNPPQDFTLSFEPVKLFRFSWTDTGNASHYHLLENSDGLSGFTPVAEHIPQGSETITLEVPLYARANAQYLLQACNGEGELEQCSDSDLISVSDALVAAIGYLKIDDTEELFSVSLSGDGHTLAVANHSENAVFLFIREGGVWVQDANLKGNNTEEGDEFGSSISLSADGQTLAVGAHFEGSSAQGINGDQHNNDAPIAGAAYVFVREANTWQQQAYLKGSNTEEGDAFGSSISLSADGQTLAIGAVSESSSAQGINGDQHNNDAPIAGAAYVFVREANIWQQQAYLKGSNTEERDEFGSSISLSADGQTLAVGAVSENSSAQGINGDQHNNDAPFAGAAYVFVREANIWQQQAYIKGSNTEQDDFFGMAISLSADGQTLAVGADLEDSSAQGINGNQHSNDAISSGAAYVFVREANIWQQQAYLKGSNTEQGDHFGFPISLSADGQTLAVGAIFEGSSAQGINGDQHNNGAISSGAAYMFARQANTWQQQAYLKSSNTEQGDSFGTTISLSGDGQTLAVSAYEYPVDPDGSSAIEIYTY